MKLLEVVPTADTRPEVVETIRRFATRLGDQFVITQRRHREQGSQEHSGKPECYPRANSHRGSLIM